MATKQVRKKSAGNSKGYQKAKAQTRSTSNRASTPNKKASGAKRKTDVRYTPMSRTHARRVDDTPHVRKEIKGLLLLTLGILMGLGLYAPNTAGLIGEIFGRIAGGAFGIMGYFIPVLLIVQGLMRIFSKADQPQWARFFSVLLMLSFMSAMFQVGAHDRSYYQNMSIWRDISEFYKEGVSSVGLATKTGIYGGGVTGGILGVPLLFAFQKVGAMIMLAVLALIMAMLITKLSIAAATTKMVKGTSDAMNSLIDAARKRRDDREMNQERELAKRVDGRGGRFIDLAEEPIVPNFQTIHDVLDKKEKKSSGRGGRIKSAGVGLTVGDMIGEDNTNEAVPISGFGSKLNVPQPEAEMPIIPVTSLDDEVVHHKEMSEPPSSAPAYTVEMGKFNTEPASEIPEDSLESVVIPPELNQTLITDGGDLPIRPYTYPPLALLKRSTESDQNMSRIRSNAQENVHKLESTLESFGIGVKVINVAVGPAFTRYELQPAPGIKVSRIVNLTDDIALNLAAAGVRIEAPIPGKAAIGVEIPNTEVAPISLRSVLESTDFQRHTSKLAVAMGKDITGENVVIDLAKMPHLLIAGATGSGKSVCINSIIISLLFKSSPDQVKLLMIDPKVVELGVYNGIPHLLIPVVTDANKAAGALRWAVQEMVTRYKLFAEKGVRDLQGYNAEIDEAGTGIKLPQIVIIIDELADLMMVAANDVEDSICRLAQMARAAGMHLVIATQRPSVNVITGVIKANIPSRIAFAVSSQVDSRTIIDMGGAEKLMGKGDMLYYPSGIPKPMRAKGAFITDKEVETVVEHVKAQMVVRYDDKVIDNINEAAAAEADENDTDRDNLLSEAIESVIDCGQASVSFIQRKFKVGYARAGRIIDQMADRGIISGYEGSKPRRVLLTRVQWMEMNMARPEGRE